MKSQKDITLKNDLDARDRLDIYRNFLLYCMSGDVVALPMGSTGALTCCPRLASEGVARFLIPGILFVFASSVPALLDGHPGRPSRSRSMKIVAVLRLKAGCWGQLPIGLHASMTGWTRLWFSAYAPGWLIRTVISRRYG